MFYKWVCKEGESAFLLVYLALNAINEFYESGRFAFEVDVLPSTNGRVIVEVLSQTTIRVRTTRGRDETITVPGAKFHGKALFLNRHFVVWDAKQEYAAAVFDIKTLEYIIHDNLLIYDSDHYYVEIPNVTRFVEVRRFDDVASSRIERNLELNKMFDNTGIGAFDLKARFIDTTIEAKVNDAIPPGDMAHFLVKHIREHNGTFYRFTKNAFTGPAIIPANDGWVAVNGLSSYDGEPEPEMQFIDVPLETV